VYAYSAYGETVALGPDGGNPLQYTGRENDGTGLYYYRARYYDPLLKQWLSEDPIGIAGGLNLRQYVNGNPVSLNDPTGQIAPIVLVGAGVVAGAAIVAGAAAVGYGAVTLGESAYNLINTLQRSQQLAEEIAEAYDACVKCNDQAACRRYVDLMQEYSKLPGAATNAGGGLSNVPSGGPLPGQIGGAAGQLNRMR
jgi:RHS repeat-associated protein